VFSSKKEKNEIVCCGFVADDGNDKYELVRRGLKVNRLEVWDNGTYECRAEVASHGNVKLRHVQLEVLCKNFTLCTYNDVSLATQNLLLLFVPVRS